jgi:hypothetical protein
MWHLQPADEHSCDLVETPLSQSPETVDSGQSHQASWQKGLIGVGECGAWLSGSV